MRFFSTSEKQTFNFAKNFAKKLKGGQVLGLVGDLGAGKTSFTKGLAAGLGVKKLVTSPTFVLMKIYPVKSFRRGKSGVIPRGKPQIKLLVHLDAYRLKGAKDLAAMGAGEYFKRPDAITVIEWADKIKKILPEKTRFIAFSHKNNARIIKSSF